MSSEQPPLIERVVAILKQQRDRRYVEEAIARPEWIDEQDAREIINAVQQPIAPVAGSELLKAANTIEAQSDLITRLSSALEEARDWMESAADRLEARDFHNASHFADSLRRQADHSRAALKLVRQGEGLRE